MRLSVLCTDKLGENDWCAFEKNVCNFKKNPGETGPVVRGLPKLTFTCITYWKCV